MYLFEIFPIVIPIVRKIKLKLKLSCNFDIILIVRYMYVCTVLDWYFVVCSRLMPSGMHTVWQLNELTCVRRCLLKARFPLGVIAVNSCEFISQVYFLQRRSSGDIDLVNSVVNTFHAGYIQCHEYKQVFNI